MSFAHLPFAFSPGCERANLILSKRARLRTASGVRLSRVAIAVVLSPAAPIDRSSPSSSDVHAGPGALISSPSARVLQACGCHVIRTLLAFILPSRVLAASKVNRSPTLILSGSIPADFNSLTCKNISGPPESSAINPKPRVEFHIFNFPAAILFSLFQPELDQAADGFGAGGRVVLASGPRI